ncbi:MAG TPA: tol-pal system protein YbgF [Burkholderiales bacterium]|nr:tol-pal system protein YbgF [Burkholderiales bacterium]
MRSVLLAAVLVVLAATVPAAAALFGDDVARKQVAEQQKQIDALYQYHQQLTERLARAEEALKNQPVMALASQIEALREDMRQLRGQIEVVGHNIDMAAKRQRDMYVDLDSRLRRLEQASAGTPPPAPPATSPPPTGAAPTGAAPGPGSAASGASTSDEGRAYEAAQQHRRSGNYHAAITAFQNFIVQHPKSPLAPRAQYWIGDSYYNMRDYKNAIANQQKLLSAYPESSSVPDALLNIASSQLELGDGAAARKTLDSVVARYPASEAAEKAKRRLANSR